MTIWHIIEIILFIILFMAIFAHKKVMENLDDRIRELEEDIEKDETDKYETDKQNHLNKII